MHTTITPQQHMAATFAGVSHFGDHDATRGRFAKPGEDQGKAIKRYMAARRRAWASPERRTFPQWVPGMSVRDYAEAYFTRNPIACGGHHWGGHGSGANGSPSVAHAMAHLQLSDEPQQLADDAVSVEYVDAIVIDAGACMDGARLAAANVIAQCVGV